MRISKVVHTYIVNCPSNIIHFMTLIGFQFRTPYINFDGIQWNQNVQDNFFRSLQKTFLFHSSLFSVQAQYIINLIASLKRQKRYTIKEKVYALI